MYHNSGQKVEMVTGSRPRDKIRQEVTGTEVSLLSPAQVCHTQPFVPGLDLVTYVYH